MDAKKNGPAVIIGNNDPEFSGGSRHDDLRKRLQAAGARSFAGCSGLESRRSFQYRVL